MLNDVAVRRFAAGLLCTALCALFTACGGNGGGGGGDGTPPVLQVHFAAAKVTLEAPGANCPAGGSRIESGIDANNNGTLDTFEVTGVQYACNGAAGATGDTGASGATGGNGGAGLASLVRIDAEAAGANCASGGSRITAGLDANANGVLDAGEVGSTSYVCSGAAGSNGSNGSNGTNGSNGSNGANGRNSLMAIANEAAGANCSYGGKKVTSGLDANGNNVLDAGEVTGTDYLCNGAPSPGLNWVNVTGTSQAMAANTGYLASNAALVTLTLPASPTIGDTVSVTGVGFGGWKIAQNAGQFITARNVANDLAAGSAWMPSGPDADWTTVASSADGRKLVAGSLGGPLKTSSDGGTTWTPRDSARQWYAVASSADGSKLVAVAQGGQIYTSADSGANWTPRDSNRNWQAVASSADGTRLIAADFGGQLYTSTDSGANWTARESSRDWSAVASSSDGTKLVAASRAGQLYTSTDSGANWTARDSGRDWSAVASSADGSKLVAVVENGQIYASTDSGANWTARDNSRRWWSVASSSDGTRLVASEMNGLLYTSTDAGVTWTAGGFGAQWFAVASSADGTRLAAVDFEFGQVHTSISGRSSQGAAGFVSGGQYDALTLQYIGNGEFVALDHALTGLLHMQ